MNKKIKKQEEYYKKLENGKGGCYTLLYDDRLRVDYIYGKNKIQLFFINLHMYFIWKFN